MMTNLTKASHANVALFDRTAMLESEIDTAIFETRLYLRLPQESGLMEWPEIKRADTKKTISLWVQNGEYWKAQGKEHAETYMLRRNTVPSEIDVVAEFSSALP